MQSGITKTKPDKRDRSFVKTFGAVSATSLPDEFDVDAGLWQPDQNAMALPLGCFPAGTPILMEDFSYKDIDRVTVGDIVFTHKGNRRKVVTKYKRGWSGQMTSIKMKGDFREMVSTPEHPYFVVKKQRRNRKDASWIKNEDMVMNIEEVEAKEIKKGDYLVIPRLIQSKDKTLRAYEKEKDFLWVLGLYSAEGSVSKYGVTFSLHAKEDYYSKRVIEIMKPLGANVTSKVRPDRDTSRYIWLGKREWVSVFKELAGVYSDKKKIATRLMFLDPSLLMHLLDGLVDGDGHTRKRSLMSSEVVSIGITSYELLVQMRLILIRNGIYPTFYKKKERDNRKQVWFLDYIKNPQRTTYITDDNYIYAQVQDVTTSPQTFERQVYNLEVEGDNSYIANGVAVHNCSGFTQGDLIADQEGVIIDPGEIYRDTPPYRNDTGRDLRTSLKRICSKPSKYYLKDGEAKPRSGYYNVRPSGKIDAFDAVRIAIWVNQQEKRSVSVGSSWFWFNPPKGIAEPQKSYAWTGALGHNYKISGWKMIDGVMYLRGKPWQGDKWGDKGWIYFNREVFNKLMKVRGNEAFTVADDSAPVQTIDWNIIDTLVNFIRELFNV